MKNKRMGNGFGFEWLLGVVCLSKSPLRLCSNVVLILLLLGDQANAQSIDGIIDDIKSKEPLSVSGSLTTGTSHYHASGISNRRNPFAFYTTLAPTISYKGFSLPFTFTYRDQKGSFSQPFQRFAFNPSYKWLTLGFGNTSLNLNPYVFSGQYYKGFSVQIKKDKFRFELGAGDLENPLAQIDTVIAGTLILPSYDRKAFAALIGYGKGDKFINFTFFRAKDNIDQTAVGLIDKSLVKPQENLAVGLNFGLNFWKKFNIKANGAASSLTTNQEAYEGPSTALDNFWVQNIAKVMTYNVSSKINFAGDFSVNFKVKQFGSGIEYKRVAPSYKTMGTYYFQEDYQSLKLKMNFSTPKNKIRLTGSAGFHQNNLNQIRSSTRTRKIINTSLTLTPSKSFFTTLRISNFQSERTPNFTRINDTLKFTQTNENYSLVPVFIFNKNDLKTTVSVMGNYQKLVDLGLNLEGNNGIDNYTGNFSYSVANVKTNVNITGNLLYNKNIAGLTTNQRIGANLTYAKKLKDKKLSLSGNLGYIKNDKNGIADGFTITTNVGVKYRIKKKISASLNALALFRSSSTQPYQEYRANAKISYQFSTKKK